MTVRPYVNGTLTKAFWNRIEFLPNGCWQWNGARVTGGYGKTKVTGQSMLTHRLMLTHLHGPIPAELHVLHKCDYPPCCNPNHLRVGTRVDNMQDMLAKGRGNKPSGARNGLAKHSPEEVQRARQLYAEGMRIADIARVTSISRWQVSRIVKGNAWPELEVA